MSDTTLDSKQLIEAIAALGARGADTVELPNGGNAVIVPEGYVLQQFPPVDMPEAILHRIKSMVNFADAPSFISYITRYRSEKTRMFALPGFLNSNQAIVRADLDYHLPDAPQRSEHFASYAPRYSEQWQRWHKACLNPLKQVEFAELIEEAAADIREPTASALLDIVRTFKAAKKIDFDSVVYQNDGGVKLHYSEDVKQGPAASGTLPERLTLGIPVYFRGAHYSVPVLVRYRVGNGGVTFQLKMDRSDVIEDAAFGELTQVIADKTAIEVYLGSVKSS